jgi:signal peptidase II
MSARPLRWVAGLALAVAVLAADQLTKHLVLQHLDPGEPILIAPFFDLVLVWNRGVSFGLLNGAGGSSPWWLIGLAGVIAALLIAWLWRETRALPQAALWLVLAGALGNVADRLRYGAVVDFLDFHLGGYHWPAFNVADSAIVIGAGLLLLDGLFLRRTTIDGGRGETDARA